MTESWKKPQEIADTVKKDLHHLYDACTALLTVIITFQAHKKYIIYGKKYIICEDSAGGSVKGQTMQNVFKNNQQFLYEYLFQNALNFLDSFKTWYVYLMII